MSMEWFIENKSMDKHSVAATKTYGTSRMDAYSIFEDTLNLKTVTVRDRIDDGDGKYHYEVNKNETMLARSLCNGDRAKGRTINKFEYVSYCRRDNICRNQSGKRWSNQAGRKGKNAWTQVV